VSGKEYSLSALIDSALQNRTDLMLAIKNKEVSEKNVELLYANRAFEFSIEAGYSYNTLVRNEIAPAPKHNSYSAGLTIPLKFSNLNKGQVNAAKLLVSQNEVIYSNIQLQITTEVTRAFYNYTAIKKQVEHYNTGLIEMAEKILNGRIFSYQRGETGLVDVLNAQKTYTSLRKDFLNIQYEYVISLIELQQVAGIWEF
jgi:cobalt-zinc-cadmium efflux system outer membrane protein